MCLYDGFIVNVTCEEVFLDTKKRGDLLLFILPVPALANANHSRTNNVGVHADMIYLPLRDLGKQQFVLACTIKQQTCNVCLQGLHGVDAITPGTSTADLV